MYLLKEPAPPSMNYATPNLEKSFLWSPRCSPKRHQSTSSPLHHSMLWSSLPILSLRMRSLRLPINWTSRVETCGSNCIHWNTPPQRSWPPCFPKYLQTGLLQVKEREKPHREAPWKSSRNPGWMPWSSLQTASIRKEYSTLSMNWMFHNRFLEILSWDWSP